jgi:hypothetical protein
LAVRALILLIRVYQLAVSPLLGNCCRFHPSCSRYAAECLRSRGLFGGLWLTLRRLLRCHPWNPGGYDPPPLPGGMGGRESIECGAESRVERGRALGVLSRGAE